MSARSGRGAMRRILVAVAATLALVGSGLAVAAPAANAASFDAVGALKSFDAGDIISDEVMFNSGTMSQSAIQTFLNTQVPTCRAGYTCLKSYKQTTTTRAADPMCARYLGASNETAATIISKVATACSVNPQVLLVILQKEQSLITDTWPGESQYRKATGYGCPDSAATCDATYNGFYNQVYKAAWAMQRYTTPPGTTGAGWTVYNQYPVGRPIGILYNPSTSCGAKTVTIKNKATASLYYYTPYTPNAGALAAGFGTASCGAYGNRNFYLYFTEWFGSTHYVVTGAISALWKAVGGAKGSLGNPTSNAVAQSAAGGGLVQTFVHGAIYSSSSGTVVVTGTMLSKYRALGGPASALGWPRQPIANSTASGGGTVQAFQSGTIYSSKVGTYAIAGAIHTTYNAAGYQRGSFGWPTSDAVSSTANGGGQTQTFVGGAIYKGSNGPAVTMSGGFLTEYKRRGGGASTLGWPTTGSYTVKAHGGGTIQTFQSGSLYLSKAGQFGVLGMIGINYSAHSGASGTLSWPTSAARATSVKGGGGYQVFAGGRIYWSNAAGAYAIGGSFLKEYLKRGGPAGSLGWPTAGGVTIKQHGGGTTQTFQDGQVYTSKFGTYAVRGAILQAYLARGGGPAGDLGWPKGTAHAVGNTTVQIFQGGRIVWSTASGAQVIRGS